MERADESQRVLPFQLQFEKPVASQIKLAEWNPEKDLLAMVTDDSKIVLHRFNWQRLWTISPGKCITSLCWSPDGKAIAVGVEDGTVSLHDVENGKLLRSVKSHNAAVSCLHWEEEEPVDSRDCGSISYEDRTTRFFPPAPRVPRMPGLVSGDSGFIDDNEDSFRELSSSSHQRFNILCSGDKDGSICFCIFGIFPIGKINIRELYVSRPNMEEQFAYHLLDSSISKVALSKDLSHLTIICSGALVRNDSVSRGSHSSELGLVGLHSLVLDTSIFWKRKNELHQVAQQASNIKDLSEVVRVSLSIMQKQWYDAMHTFHEKFSSLSTLIIDNGLDSSPKEELLSLLGGARVSSAVHQFLVNSLGEAGVKRVSKTISATGKELQLIVLDHLQPAAEVIGFRIGELRGLSKWRSRFKGVGLDEKLINNATERAGMLLIQVERFMRVLSSVVQQFTNFFNWLLKCIKMLMSEPSDQLPPFNSELVILFLKFLYDQDPVGHLLELAENIEVDLETTQRVGELSQFGGFTDSKFLRRTLAKEFDQMEASFKEAFLMPFTTVSEKICCKDFLPLFPCASPPMLVPIEIPTTISYYKDGSQAFPNHQANGYQYIDYISFRTPDGSDLPNCIGVARGFIHDSASTKKGYSSLEVVFLHVPDGYHCVDLSLYKESQMVLLLNESTSSAESSGNAVLMILQAGDLPFLSLSRSTSQISWTLKELKDAVVHLQMENEKFRLIPHSVITPLAVSASRGVACVFTGRKRALVYILEEDEEENSDEESE